MEPEAGSSSKQYGTLSLVQLRSELKRRNLRLGGRKKDLVAR